MPRTRLVAIVVAIALTAAVAGWFAGTRMRSPAEIAADRQPPDASLVTAQVEARQLSSTVVARGTVRYGEPKEITLPSSPTGEGATVTRPPSKGTSLTEGSVAMEVSGRPTIVLQGGSPMYRDIGPGDHGDDVRQLEEALARLGFSPGEVDGRYDAATEGAVDEWYRALGSTARGPSEEERAALRQARDAVASAEERLLQARSSLATAEEGPGAGDVAEAAARVRAAQRALDDATRAAEIGAERLRVAQVAERAAAATAEIAESRVALAGRSLAATRANQRRDDARAEADVLAAERAAETAEDRLDVSEAVLDELEERRDDADATNDPSESELEQARADRNAAEAAVEAAEDDLGVARLARDATLLAGREAVTAAEIAVAEAEATVLTATAARMSAAVDAQDAALTGMKAVATIAGARDDLVVAEAREAQLREPKDVAVLQEGVAGAERALADARAALAELDGETGIVVPANEVLFFPVLPLRVDQALAEAGDDATEPVMTVTTSRLAVDVAVPVADARLVAPGDDATITASDLGIEVTGTVTEKAAEAGTDGVEANQVYVEVTPEDAPPELTGASVRVSIAVESTDGEVMTVPVAAVSVAPDGSSRVQVEDAPGDTRWVTVEPGLAANGLVEVSPVSGELEPGDRVVVGEDDG